jgi:hypothetical protein
MEAEYLEAVPPLNPAEAKRLTELEQQVSKNFYRAGKALKEIRDNRLYRQSSPTFEGFCEQKFSISRRYGYYLIEAAVSVDEIKLYFELQSKKNQGNFEQGTNPAHLPVLPTSEFQIRPLGKLHPRQRGKVWAEVVEECLGARPSHAVVAQTVMRHMVRFNGGELPHVEPTTGSLCFINKKGWGFVQKATATRIEVHMWDGTVAHSKRQSCLSLSDEPSILKIYQQLQSILSKISARVTNDANGSTILQIFSQRTSTQNLSGLELDLLRVLVDHFR